MGSAFDIISGEQPRAPRVMRDNGFEWLHRLRLDPGRLARRYLIEDSGFLPLLAAGVAESYGRADKVSRRVLITGGCGFVGRRFTKDALVRGDDVVVVDDLSTGLHPSQWPQRLQPTGAESRRLRSSSRMSAGTSGTAPSRSTSSSTWPPSWADG